MRFLVAEDNANHRKLLEHAVHRFDSDAELTFVGTGQAFIERFSEDSFDLALLDYYLPDLDAGQVLERLRLRANELPVIVLSSAPERGPVIDSLRRGGRDFIPKDEAFLGDGLRQRIEDVLQRVRTERLLLDAQKDECLSLLAGGIAHDLNNRLQTIMGCAGLLRDRSDDEPSRRLSSAIARAGERIAELSSQLIAYAREGCYQPVPGDLNVFVRNTLRLLQARTPRDVRIDVRLGRDLWPIEADEVQLSQMIINVCINAFESMRRGGGLRIETDNTVRYDDWHCAFRDDHPAGEYVRLTVADDGCGMDDATLERIFEPFFTLKHTGRGLGLSAVAGIVHSHGGCVSAESEPGKGTRVVMELPRPRSSYAELPRTGELA